jgi:transcriptional regulator with XRE-family HTH domain
MATVERTADLAARRTATILRSMGEEVRNGRLARGLSQMEIAKAATIRQATVSQIERGERPTASVRDLAHLLASVGLELSVRAYPAGPPVRDAAQRALLERLRARVAPTLNWRYEVPLPIPGDQRAWDAVIDLPDARVAVEAETRVRDVQALQRRISLKCRDDPDIALVLILLAATRSNRAVMRAEAMAFRAEYPLPAREMLACLSKGRAPEASGVVLL